MTFESNVEEVLKKSAITRKENKRKHRQQVHK